MNSKVLKKVSAAFLAIIMMLVMIPLASLPVAAATTGSCGTNVTWSLDTTTNTLTISGSGAMNDYKMFTRAPWYSSRSLINSVIVEEGVTNIGNYAFDSASNLVNVTIPDSVTSIGESAFYFCTSLAKIEINNNITTLGKNSFRGCSSLTEVTVGNGVKTIGNMAFCECTGLINITLPKGLEMIDTMAFFNCTAAKTITYCGTEAEWENVTKGTDWNYSCRATIKFYDENGNPIVCTHTTVSNGVCTECGLMVGTCGESLTWTLDKDTGALTISGTGAMYEFGTESNFPWYNDRLSVKSININEGVTSIAGYAFHGCAYAESLTLPESLTSIGNNAFLSCYGLVGDLVIPQNVTHIGEYAFYSCNKLTSLTILGALTEINRFAFMDCGFISITLPDSITAIGNYAFSNCLYVRKLIIPDSVTSIGDRAFYACLDLTSITLPEKLETVSENAFERCYRLVEIINRSELDLETGSTNFGGVAQNAIEVHTGSSKVVASGDYEFYTYGGVNYLVNYVGEGTNITLPESYKGEAYEINDFAFIQCWKLTDVTITDKVTKIGDYAFKECSNLTNVVISDSVTYLGNSAFYECAKLVSVNIPDSLTSIESYTFYNCSKITSIIIPNSVNSINDYAFYNCRGITTLTYCGTENEWNEVTKGNKWNNNVAAAVQFHNSVDGICSICGKWDGATNKIFGANVTLDEDLSVKYYVYLTDDKSDAVMKYTMNGKTVTVEGIYSETEGHYEFIFDNIAPQCMGDTITAVLMLGDETLATKQEYSVLQNAENLLASYADNAEVVALIKAMLNYGAAAQTYMDYKTDALVNAGYETEAMAPESSVSVKNTENNGGDGMFKAAGVYFDNVNKLYVKILADEKPTVTVNGAEAVVEEIGNGEWIVYTEGILVSDFDEAYTFIITSNQVLPTFTYSINSYTYSMQSSTNANMRALAIATYAYGVAAEAYNK